MTSPNSGLLLIDKPAGLTSQQAVVRVRKALGLARAGHTGTLDPFATGLLVILVARATRLAAFVKDEPKVYETCIRFGAETDTDDVTGDVVRTAPPPTAEAIVDAIAALTGDMAQVPPTFSAKHIAGNRAYTLARRGKAADLAPAKVRVEHWEILDQTRDSLRARISCSRGTYIRALARDMGRLTSSAAHCAELRRVRAGVFSVADAVVPDLVTPDHIRPAGAELTDLPTQDVDERAALGIAHGRAVAATISGTRAALVKDGELLAIAERSGEQWLPRVVLSDPSNYAPRA